MSEPLNLNKIEPDEKETHSSIVKAVFELIKMIIFFFVNRKKKSNNNV